MKKRSKIVSLVYTILIIVLIAGAVEAQDCMYAGRSYPGGVSKADLMNPVWEETSGPPNMYTIESIVFVPPNTLLAAGEPDIDYDGLIWVSNDFGLTWQTHTVNQELNGAYTCRKLLNANNGKLYAVGDNHVFYSINMWNIWIPAGDMVGSEEVFELVESGPNQLLAGTGPGAMIFRTTDGGVNWTQVGGLGQSSGVTALLNIDGTNFLAGTSNPGLLMSSSDGGMSWTENTVQIPQLLEIKDLLLRPDGIIVASCSPYGRIYFSEDMGSSWQPAPAVGVYETFDLVHGADDYTYVSTSSPAGVFKWNPGMTDWIQVGDMGNVEAVKTLYFAPCREFPTPTPTPTFTPRPTPTPWESGGTSGSVSSGYIYPGERCLFTVGVQHMPDGGAAAGFPGNNDFKLFVVLDISGQYFFWDGWTEEVDYLLLENLPPGTPEKIQIMDFEWPDIEGWFWRVRLWTGLLYADTNELHGDFDYDDFEYGPPPETPTPVPDPTATPQTAQLSVLFNNDDSPISFDCGDERVYCFGEQHFPTSYYRVATLKNTGGQVLSVNMLASGADADLFEVEETMSFQISPGSNKDLRIRFNPSGVPGMKYGSIGIAGSGPTEVIEFQGHFVY